MKNEYVVHDVMDCVITDLATGKVMANSKLQMSAIEGTISEEDIRGGIGNGKLFKMRSDRDLNVSMRNAVMDNSWIEMTQGVDILTDKTVEITKAEVLCDIPEGGVVQLQDTPVGKVKALKKDGTSVPLDATGKEITLTEDLLEQGDVQVSYMVEVQGDSIVFDAKKFSKAVRLDFSTIAYDLDTGEVFADIYFVFPKALPSSELSLSFEAGSVISPEIAFSILTGKCNSEMGEMVSVVRDVEEVDVP